MKIAHIAPPWIAVPPTNYGGTEAVIFNLVEEQVAQGHDVTLFAPADARITARLISFFPHALRNMDVPWTAYLQAFYHIYKAVDYIKEHDFDIMHTHLSSSTDMCLFPLTARMDTPHIMTLHSRFPFDNVGTWTGRADELYMEWAQTVPMVAISKNARDGVPYKLNLIGIVPHGLPLSDFVPSGQPQNYFAWLGRIVPEKGAHRAIQAAKLAGVPLVIAGNIEPDLPKTVAYFKQEIQPHIDNEQIQYIGPVDRQQKIDLLSHACGLLNPIEWEEPFGLVMLEAMALGCPVISFARGAAPEIIIDGCTGFLVDSIDEMAHAIDRVRALNRVAIRAFVEQNFSARIMAEKYLSLYRSVIEACGAASTSTAATALTPTPIVRLRPIDSSTKMPVSHKAIYTNLESEPTP